MFPSLQGNAYDGSLHIVSNQPVAVVALRTRGGLPVSAVPVSSVPVSSVGFAASEPGRTRGSRVEGQRGPSSQLLGAARRTGVIAWHSAGDPALSGIRAERLRCLLRLELPPPS